MLHDLYLFLKCCIMERYQQTCDMLKPLPKKSNIGCMLRDVVENIVIYADIYMSLFNILYRRLFTLEC